MIKIKSTTNITSEGANLVIYGESGVGKTKLIADLKNQIILSADKGLLTLKNFDIPYIEITNAQDVDDAYEYLISKKGDMFEHIIFDSLTEMAETVLFTMKEGKKDKRQAYGELADAFGVMIRKFRDIPGKNTIFVAKRKEIYDEDDVIIGFAPMMPGRVLPHGLPYLTDEVFSYEMDRKGKRFLRTQADRKHPAKDRSNELAPMELEPNLNDIITRVLSGQEKQKNG